MIEKQLRKHQRMAFMRHPLFGRNLGVKIFIFIFFGFLAAEFFTFGFFLDKVCLELGNFTSPLDCFNSGLLYMLMGDFAIKLVMKSNQAMQIAPYLTLPVKRKKLFNFLLSQEFVNLWNWYGMFLIIPFAFKVVPSFYGFLGTVVFLLYFYLLCIGNSLLVALVKNWLKDHLWRAIFPALVFAGILFVAFGLDFSFGDYTQKIGEWLLQLNPLVWFVFIVVFVLLWMANHLQMRQMLYREMQGDKIKDSVSFSKITFLDKFGPIGEYINLEIKLIFRTKRMKRQFVIALILVPFFMIQFYANPVVQTNYWMQLFWMGFVLGSFGLMFSQFLFMAESSYFDGLMARKHSFLSLMRAKYYLYCSISFVSLIVFLIVAYFKEVNLLQVISIFFYQIGVVYCIIFQNGVYNKSPFDLSDSGFMNWKTTSASQMVISLVGMFIPILIANIIRMLTSEQVANCFMLISGLIFVLGSNVWLKWTYNRVMKRKYMLMEGFRSSN